jgi:hypothetical protein
MKRHFKGATYDLTQENMNHLIEQLEETRERASKLSESRNYWADRTRLAMKQLAEAESLINELCHWSLDDYSDNDIDLSTREYFYNKLNRNR